MKRLFLGFTAIAIAVGASAFTSASENKAASFATITYYQSDPITNTYVKTNPGGECTEDTEPCNLQFPNPDNVNFNDAPTSFTAGSEPIALLGQPTPSIENGYYH